MRLEWHELGLAQLLQRSTTLKEEKVGKEKQAMTAVECGNVRDDIERVYSNWNRI